MSEINSIGYEENALPKARLLAKQLSFNLDKDAPHCVFVTREDVSLKIPGFSLLAADFSWSHWQKRKGEGKKQGLVRACKPNPRVKIIDATAGWGRDAAVLSSFGAEVLMLERNSVMAVILADALERQTEIESQKMRLSLYAGNAYSYLELLSEQNYPDIIYIDPMHPERSKSALVKKDMQALQQMIGPDYDALELIQMARTRVKQKVVVKWPQKVNSLLPASGCIAGKTVRFDFYLPVI
jgi:16S rRNA (guanine1516-N2)-methyltransferase